MSGDLCVEKIPSQRLGERRSVPGEEHPPDVEMYMPGISKCHPNVKDQSQNHLPTCHVSCHLSTVTCPLAVRAYCPRRTWCLVDHALPLLDDRKVGIRGDLAL